MMQMVCLEIKKILKTQLWCGPFKTDFSFHGHFHHLTLKRTVERLRVECENSVIGITVYSNMILLQIGADIISTSILLSLVGKLRPKAVDGIG